MYLQLLTTLAFFTSSALSLGINCRGSFLCPGGKHGTRDLVDLIDSIDGGLGTTWAGEHQYIACHGGICAFYQNTDGYGGSIEDAQRLAHEIYEHGCNLCGSCPVDYPYSNNVKDGELTINYVHDSCLGKNNVGVCPDFQDQWSRIRADCSVYESVAQYVHSKAW